MDEDTHKTFTIPAAIVTLLAGMFGLSYYTGNESTGTLPMQQISPDVKQHLPLKAVEIPAVTEIEELPVGELVPKEESDVDLTTPYEPREDMDEYIPPEPLPPEAEYAPTYEDGQRQLAPEVKEEPAPKKKVTKKAVLKPKSEPAPKPKAKSEPAPKATAKAWKPRNFTYDNTYSVTKKKFESNSIIPEGANARFGRDVP